MKNARGKLGKRGKLAIIIGVIAVVLLGGGLIVRGTAARKALAASAGAAETVTLKKSDLTQSIHVSGVVQSAQTANIYSMLNSPVQEILAAVGDTVEAGDVLAVLDTAALENNISQAEITYGGAQDTAAEEKRALKDAAANAQNALRAAQITAERQALATANAEKDLAAARADARKPFDSTLTDRAINEAGIALERARKNTHTAQAEYDKARYSFDEYRYQNAITDAAILLERRQADLAGASDEKSYSIAQNAVDDAQRTLDRAQADLTRAQDDAIKLAKDKLDAAKRAQADAQRAYEKAFQDKQRAAKDYKEANEKKVESAEKLLADAKKQLEAAQNSRMNAENALKQAQAKPGSAGINVELQELSLEELNRQLANGQIVAEASGVITAMTAKVGAIPQGALFVIDNKDEFYVSARVKEHNLNSIWIGQEALITTEATGSQKFSAAISYISPKAVTEAGSTSVEFEVRATISDPDDAIKIGMNAFLDIILETKENIYAAPISAVVTNERGSFVYAGPERLEIPVTPGLKTSNNVEITGAGIKDGLQILTDPEGKLSEAQPRAFGFMSRFGGGR